MLKRAYRPWSARTDCRVFIKIHRLPCSLYPSFPPPCMEFIHIFFFFFAGLFSCIHYGSSPQNTFSDTTAIPLSHPRTLLLLHYLITVHSHIFPIMFCVYIYIYLNPGFNQGPDIALSHHVSHNLL